MNFFGQQGLFILISLGLACIYIFLKGRIMLDLITGLTFAFALSYSVSAFVYYRENALTTTMYAASLLVFIQFFNCFENKKKFMIGMGSAYVGGLFVSFLLIVLKTYWVQGLSFAGDAVNNFWTGEIISRTGLSLYEMGFLGVVVATLCFKSKFRKWYTLPALLFIFGFCVYVSFVIGNRSFLVAVAILIYFLVVLKIILAKKWVGWAVLLGFLSVIIIGTLVIVTLVNKGTIKIPEELLKINIFKRLFTIDPTEGRPEIVEQFFREFYKYPFGGYSKHIDGYVHNFLLDFYSFGGVIPFLVASAFLVFLFMRLYMVTGYKCISSYEKGLMVCISFAVLGIGFIEPIYQANPNCVTIVFLIFLYANDLYRRAKRNELPEVVEEEVDETKPVVEEVVEEEPSVSVFEENDWSESHSVEDSQSESAIILITYNKADALQKSFNNLLKVDYLGKSVDLIISIDNSGTDDVENLAKTLSWPYGDLIIRTFNDRQGLKKHILKCFMYAEKYEMVFLFEDDIYVSEAMFAFGYNAAKFYDNDPNIAGISLYNFQGNWQNWALRFEPMNVGFDSYFIRLAQSWGEVVTTKQWLAFKEWYMQNEVFVKDKQNVASINKWPDSSWLKYFDRYCFLNNKFFVYPFVSLSTNCNGTGIHNSNVCNDFQVELQGRVKEYKFQPFELDNSDVVAYDEYFNPLWIDKYVDINADELTVDLWCTKDDEQFKKYVLTAGYYGKKYLKSYSLSLHPIELSIMNNVEGKGIYLYESKYLQGKSPKMYPLLNYSNRTSDWRRIKFYGFVLFFKTFFGLIKKKIKETFN